MAAKQFCLYLSVFWLLFPFKLAFGSELRKAELLLQDSIQINHNLPVKIASVPDPPADGDGRPRGNTGGGGTRGGCPQDVGVKPELTLLTPNNKQVEVGLTVEKSPTFFVFVPQTTAKKGEFVLYDRTEKKLIYETTFDLSNLPGIVSIKLPNDRVSLKINNDYEWRFLLRCKVNDERSQDVMKIGRIKRVEPVEAIAKISSNSDPLEKARVYQKNQIWYDALQTLAALRSTNSNNSNATEMWQELLQAQDNLKEIVSYPLINCCKPAN